MPRKTKYSDSWKAECYTRKDGKKELLDWIQPVRDNPYMARCGLCPGSKPFSVENGGLSQVKRHAETTTHSKILESRSSQSVLVSTGPCSNVQLSSAPIIIDSAAAAEIIQALKIVESNMSFASANGDAARFAAQFPDSAIAKNYAMGETKARYIIVHGIYPYLRKSLLADLKAKPFTFRFDETTTSQIKKQYDGHVTFFSDSERRVITRYAESLFVGKCCDADLLDHFFKFMENLKLDTNFHIGLGMDGPNVNKSFEKLLVNKLESEKGCSFLSKLGYCVLHIVNNGFGVGIKALKEVMDIEQLLIDLHFFFKYSAKRREEYKEMEKFTDVAAEYLLKPCTTRWLYIGKVCVRLLEQIDNIQTYFLTHLPQQKGFNYKDGVGNSERYKRIKQGLNNSYLKSILAFVVYFCNIFKPFVLLFQSKTPLIHILHGRMKQLLTDIISKFLSTKYLSAFLRSRDGLLNIEELENLDIENESHYNAKRDIGCKAKEFLEEKDSLERKRFTEGILTKVYVATAKYLIANLPLTNQILIDVKYLHPNMIGKSGASNSIQRLAECIWKCLGPSAKDFFECKDNLSDFKDQIRLEVTMLQLEKKMPEKLKKAETKRTSRVQPSYWKKAYSLAGIEENHEDAQYSYRPIDEFWVDIGNILDEVTGTCKYPMLSKLVAKSICVLPHANADPERGFSLNKKILDVHGSSIQEDTIVALRFVKDELILRGGVLNIKLNRELIDSCKGARKIYQDHLIALERQKELECKAREEAERRKESEKGRKEKVERIQKMERDLELLMTGVIAADKAISEGNDYMGKEVVKEKADLRNMRTYQSQISMGVKRKQELQGEIAELKSKIAKAEKKLDGKNAK